MFYISKSDFSKTLKSFARAFSKARRVEGRSPSWVLRATPLTFFDPKEVDFVHLSVCRKTPNSVPELGVK